jgi:hypothetical protein
MESLEHMPVRHRPVTPSRVFRSLLLLGRARSGGAKVVRVLYYLSLSLITFWIAVGFSTLRSFRISDVVATILVALPAFLPPWGLYSLVIWLDKRYVAAHTDVDERVLGSASYEHSSYAVEADLSGRPSAAESAWRVTGAGQDSNQ